MHLIQIKLSSDMGHHHQQPQQRRPASLLSGAIASAATCQLTATYDSPSDFSAAHRGIVHHSPKRGDFKAEKLSR
jgi:hypothetical protein